jgi:prepilin-type N-terminal cleavage/methylation domain-containing protein
MKIKPANFQFKIISQKGFTLIEVLVVVAVIASLAGLSIATFGNYTKSQVFKQAYNNFLNVLNTAKSRSSSQDKPLSIAQCAATGAVLNGYSVTLDKTVTPNTYSLNVKCSNTTVVLPGYSQLPLPAGVTFGGSSLTSVFFPVITGGAVLNNSGLTTGTITINSGSSLTKSITVDGKTGRIQ